MPAVLMITKSECSSDILIIAFAPRLDNNLKTYSIKNVNTLSVGQTRHGEIPKYPGLLY